MSAIFIIKNIVSPFFLQFWIDQDRGAEPVFAGVHTRTQLAVSGARAAAFATIAAIGFDLALTDHG